MTKPRDPPDLLVEQLALGELDEAQAVVVRAALTERQPDRLAQLEASNVQILADYPAERVAADVRRRLEREPPARPRRSIVWLAGPLVAAAVVLIWWVNRDEPTTIASGDTPVVGDVLEPDRVRIKGGVEPSLVLDRQTPSGPERLSAGDIVRAGELVQVRTIAAGRSDGVIVSIDGAGVVTLHHPSSADAPTTLAPAAETPLAHAYQLDAAPGFERFVLVTRDDGPVSVAVIVAAAEQLAKDPEQAESGSLVLPGPGWNQASLLVRKPDPDGAGP